MIEPFREKSRFFDFNNAVIELSEIDIPLSRVVFSNSRTVDRYLENTSKLF